MNIDDSVFTLAEKGIIQVFGEINSDLATIVNAQCLHLMNMVSGLVPTTIHVTINSNGGATNDAFAIINSLTLLKSVHTTKIITTVFGDCDSCAVDICLFGDWRRAFKNSLFMLHRPSLSSSDSSSDRAKTQAKADLLRLEEQRGLEHTFEQIKRARKYNEKVSNKKLSNTRKETLTNYLIGRDYDTFLTAKEALDLGIIDEII